MSAHELVNHALDRCWGGKRNWYVDAGYPSLESFLRWVMRSLLGTETKAASRDRADLSADGHVDEAAGEPSPESIVADQQRTEVVNAIAACADGEADLEAYYCTVLDGHIRREDIAEQLEWSVDRVTAARIKLQRRCETRYPHLFGSPPKARTS